MPTNDRTTYMREYQRQRRLRQVLALARLPRAPRTTMHPALRGLTNWMATRQALWASQLALLDERCGEWRESEDPSRRKLVREATIERRDGVSVKILTPVVLS